MWKSSFLISVFALITCFASAQFSIPDSSIRISGIILHTDSLLPVPYATVYIKGQTVGTRSDNAGLFSISANHGDTILFTSIGNQPSSFIVPDTLKATSYSIIQRMVRDTISLNRVDIVSWPTIQEFNESFHKKYGIDEGIVNAETNSNPENMRQRKYDIGMDAGANFKYNAQNEHSYIYENAHIPLNQVLNPKKWNELIKGMKGQ